MSKFRLLVILTVAACTIVLIVYWPVLSAKALAIDDDQYLGRNKLVQNPSWDSARRFVTEVLRPSTVHGYYQPLAMISLMVDYALGGRENNLMPFHRTSLILHIANTALIIVLLYLLFGQTLNQSGSGQPVDELRVVSKVEPIWIAAGVGLLFGVHPMTVEPIPWVGERKTLLAAFFALWCLVFYVVYTRKKDRRIYIWCFVMYLLALMSKPTSIPLPAVMLLMDYWPLRRLSWQTVLEKLPFFALGAVFIVITYISQSRVSYVLLPGQYNPKFIPLILCHNIVFYLYKIVWPVNLSLHYAFPEPLNMSEPMVLVGVIGTCILIPILVLSLRWTRGALTGFSVFFVAILPTMQIIGFSNVIASDKFAYLPSVGLLMILTSFLIWLSRTSYVAKAKIWCIVLTVTVLMPAGFESVATRRYLACWRDSVTLFEYVLKLTPDSPIVNYELGYEFQCRGRLDDAVKQYNRALQSDPGYVKAYINIGVALEMKGQLDEAEGYLRRASQLAPSDANIYVNLANIFQLKGRFDKAIDCFKEALKINPNDIEACIDLGVILASTQRFDEAADCFRRALQLEPDNEVVLDNLARILARHPQPEKHDAVQAVAFARQAAELTRYRNAAVLDTLAAAYAAAGQFDKAVATEQAALDLASDSNNKELTAQIAKQLKIYEQKKR